MHTIFGYQGVKINCQTVDGVKGSCENRVKFLLLHVSTLFSHKWLGILACLLQTCEHQGS